MPYWRHPSGALWFAFEPDDADARAVKRTLKSAFGAAFGDGWEDPLGDSAFVRFSIDGCDFELDWHYADGLKIISWDAANDDVIRQIGAHFEANPPPRR